jgi:hypothetical protein
MKKQFQDAQVSEIARIQALILLGLIRNANNEITKPCRKISKMDFSSEMIEKCLS